MILIFDVGELMEKFPNSKDTQDMFVSAFKEQKARNHYDMIAGKRDTVYYVYKFKQSYPITWVKMSEFADLEALILSERALTKI